MPGAGPGVLQFVEKKKSIIFEAAGPIEQFGYTLCYELYTHVQSNIN